MTYFFIHGLGQNETSWQAVLTNLNVNIETNCPELFSEKEKLIDYETLYRKFKKYLSQYKAPIHLCGLSLGGILSLQYALENPTKVSSLVLIGTPCKIPKSLMYLQNIIFYLLPKSIFQKQGLSKQQMIYLAKSMIDIDFSAKLSEIECATLIVCGTKDQANKKSSMLLQEKIQDAEIKWIDGKHELNKENPEELAKILHQFYF